ncbi:hypothetical protein J3R83DRAFT_13345 [Lanmaoa asiatica]|nr:hypothetical protein J3R83DRAFT_13345 [Lanmaoa asiatica]
MSSAPLSTPPSPAELENLSVLFVGFVAATVLYGLTFFQTYIYYSRYPRDSKWIRYLVCAYAPFVLRWPFLTLSRLYYYLIIMFDVNMDVLYATTNLSTYLVGHQVDLFGRSFFTHRVFQAASGQMSVISHQVASCALLICDIIRFAQRRLSAFGSLQMQITAAIGQVTGMIADVIIFATMCHSLRRARFPEMVVSVEAVLDSVANDRKQAWYVLIFACPNADMDEYSLNARDVKHGQGLNEEDSLTDRKAPANNSIRLNVTDVKVNHQSINLTTQHNNTESEGTGIESRKTYQDENGSEYVQVSSGSTQSQTDEANKDDLSEHLA